MRSEPRILLQCRDAHLAAALRAALADHGFDVRAGMGHASEPHACEVVVADQSEGIGLPRPLGAAQARGLVGLVLIGPACGADVVLPSDCSTREVVLACQLLAEIVRLRRDRRRGRGAWRRLHQLAHQDPLTELPNRRYWDRELSRGASRPGRSPVAIALLDVDAFKRLNSELGMPAGDRVLAAVGQALSHALRAQDLAAQLGGDEFALMVRDAEPEHAPAIVERVRQLCGEAASRAAGGPVSLSAGVAVATPPDEQAHQTVVRADAALRAAKASGRNQTVTAPPVPT